MDKVIQTFEGLIRRSLAPSVTFFIVLALGELIRVKLNGELARDHVARFLKFVTSEPLAKSPTILITLAVLSIIGLSYGLQAIQQVAFDNRLKKDFDPWPSSGQDKKSESHLLTELRKKVVQRLKAELDLTGLRDLPEFSDYILYEIVGGIDPTDTRSFVDSAKAVGIFFVSVILVLVGNAVVLMVNAAVYCHYSNLWVLVVLLPLVGIFYWGGLEATRSQYRARALRLYVNFLAMPTQRIHRRLLRPDEEKAPASEKKEEKKDS